MYEREGGPCDDSAMADSKLTDWLSDWLNDWLVDRMAGWLTD